MWLYCKLIYCFFLSLLFPFFSPLFLQNLLSFLFLVFSVLRCAALRGREFSLIKSKLLKDWAQHLNCVTVYISNWTQMVSIKCFLSPCNSFWRLSCFKTLTLRYIVSLSAPRSPLNIKYHSVFSLYHPFFMIPGLPWLQGYFFCYLRPHGVCFILSWQKSP